MHWSKQYWNTYNNRNSYGSFSSMKVPKNTLEIIEVECWFCDIDTNFYTHFKLQRSKEHQDISPGRIQNRQGLTKDIIGRSVSCLCNLST